MTESQQKEVLIQPSNFITASQQDELWAQVIFDKKASVIWSCLLDNEKTQSLKSMDAKIQIELWTQICEKDQKSFLTFLNEKNKKIKFWSCMSHQLQDCMLDLLSQHQIKELLNLLDQDNLCLTVSMHKDKVLPSGNFLMDLLTDENK